MSVSTASLGLSRQQQSVMHCRTIGFSSLARLLPWRAWFVDCNMLCVVMSSHPKHPQTSQRDLCRPSARRPKSSTQMPRQRSTFVLFAQPRTTLALRTQLTTTMLPTCSANSLWSSLWPKLWVFALGSATSLVVSDDLMPEHT